MRRRGRAGVNQANRLQNQKVVAAATAAQKNAKLEDPPATQSSMIVGKFNFKIPSKVQQARDSMQKAPEVKQYEEEKNAEQSKKSEKATVANFLEIRSTQNRESNNCSSGDEKVSQIKHRKQTTKKILGPAT